MQRNQNLDLIRVIACLAVVTLHVSARAYYLHLAGTVGAPTFFVGAGVNSATRWCVAVFVMLSGALILSRAAPWGKVYLSRIPRMLAVLLIATILYGFWRYHLGGFEWATFAFDVLRAKTYYHLYFLYVVTGLYAATPLIAPSLQSLGQQDIFRISAWLLGLSSLLGIIGMFTGDYSRHAFSFSWDYLGYFILGYGLVRFNPKLPYARMAIAGYLATFLWVEGISLIWGMKARWITYAWSYFSPFTICAAIGVFGFLLNFKLNEKAQAIVSRLAPLTLIVYLIHPIVLESLRRGYLAYVPVLQWEVLDLPVTLGLTVLISFVAAALLRRIPYVKTIL